MDRDVIITLIPTVPDKDDDGYPIMAEGEPRNVFAETKSVKQSEFYNGLLAKVRAELIVKLRIADYNGEQIIVVNKKRYTVLRTYETDREYVEITLKA